MLFLLKPTEVNKSKYLSQSIITFRYEQNFE